MSAWKELDEASKELVETHKELNQNIERFLESIEKEERALDLAPFVFLFWLVLFTVIAVLFLI